MDKIIQDISCKNYVLACHEVHKYLKNDLYPPKEVEKIYKEFVFIYQQFLDDKSYKMPKQKYSYLISNKSTWKYLDVKIVGDRSKINCKCVDVLNNNWKYKDKV